MSWDLRRIETGTRLEIIRSAHRLRYIVGDRSINTYPVAVGKQSTPTPLGIYKVVNKVVNPGGVLGTRWLGLNIPGGNYGIHGTSSPSSIGKYISNGCIRMYNQDVEQIFPNISIGTPVIISDGEDSHPDPQTGGRQHVVRPGDTLWKISQTYQVTVNDIVMANNLSNPDVLVPGQVLVIS